MRSSPSVRAAVHKSALADFSRSDGDDWSDAAKSPRSIAAYAVLCPGSRVNRRRLRQQRDTLPRRQIAQLRRAIKAA
jgi:hypothetical protein